VHCHHRVKWLATDGLVQVVVVADQGGPHPSDALVASVQYSYDAVLASDEQQRGTRVLVNRPFAREELLSIVVFPLYLKEQQDQAKCRSWQQRAECKTLLVGSGWSNSFLQCGPDCPHRLEGFQSFRHLGTCIPSPAGIRMTSYNTSARRVQGNTQCERQ
jgi:hypothetical protein